MTFATLAARGGVSPATGGWPVKDRSVAQSRVSVRKPTVLVRFADPSAESTGFLEMGAVFVNGLMQHRFRAPTAQPTRDRSTEPRP
ncbi:MAG: hypothetical protein D6788_11260 [Planctomycetota bacterium]|nr:MAG: hypothetical protein D6788_11260 [Planctomycetota bacterium]